MATNARSVNTGLNVHARDIRGRATPVRPYTAVRPATAAPLCSPNLSANAGEYRVANAAETTDSHAAGGNWGARVFLHKHIDTMVREIFTRGKQIDLYEIFTGRQYTEWKRSSTFFP
ncbi:MAG: hypothetical protein ACK4M3_08125 [Pyrobaculum sp.]